MGPDVGLLASRDVPSGSVALKVIGEYDYWKDVGSVLGPSMLVSYVLQHRNPSRSSCLLFLIQ